MAGAALLAGGGGVVVGRRRGEAEPPTGTLAAPPPGDAAIAPAPASFSGAAPRSRPAPRALRTAPATPGPGVWAVIVGVNDYPGTQHDLRSAVADAEDVNLALARFGVPDDHRLVLRDGQVSRPVLQAALKWLTRHAGRDATAVFFFAGHVRKLGRSTEAMVAADGSLLTDADLAHELAHLQAERAWIVMAACYGGGFTEALQPGRVVTAAAGPDEIAYENLGFGRSYLVQYMVRQGFIEGRATESVQAAFSYAHDALARDYPNRVPRQYDQAGAALDLRQAGYRAPPPEPAKPAPQQQPASSGGSSPTTTSTSTTSTSTTTTTRRCAVPLLQGC
jgi:hypothetical protein